MNKSKQAPVVSVVMGSDSDYTVMEEAVKVLDSFAVPSEVFLTSAHRSPERTASFAAEAAARGIKIVIVGAGAAAKDAVLSGERCAEVRNTSLGTAKESRTLTASSITV